MSLITLVAIVIETEWPAWVLAVCSLCGMRGSNLGMKNREFVYECS